MQSETLRTHLPTPFTFSQSSLQDYADCPRRFQLRYIEQLSWPAIESEPLMENERRQQEGQVFHRLVQQHMLGLSSDKLARQANTANLERWWQNYMNVNLGISDYAHRAEFSLSCPMGQHRLFAKYDLVAIKTSEKALILDWKTSARRPSDEWLVVRWQTRIYRALLVLAGSQLNDNKPINPEQIEMIYWFAEFPSEPARFTYNEKQFKRDLSAIEKIVNEISSSNEFPMIEDEKTCRFCMYRSYCNRGNQAGDEKESLTEIEADSAFDINFEQVGEIEF